jgi:UDP-GlcNAc:undecaprenyl-phosphate GlcNAc-1-phosphate transferase
VLVELVVVLIVGLAGGVVGTGIARSVALRTGFVNHPNPIVPDHVQPVAYLGGIGIVAGATAGTLTAATVGVAPGVPHGLIFGALGMLLVGLYDDLRALDAKRKLVLQLAVVLVALAIGGLKPVITGNAMLDTAFSFLWLLGVVNAFNFIDVLDGLAGSVAVATLAMFGLVFGMHPPLTVAVISGTLGFLVWNRPPARVFMGDAGSHFLGFILAAYALMAPVPGVFPYVASIALFLAPALFDLVFQTTVRMYHGRRWWVAGPDSFALHLRASGLSKEAVIACTVATAVALWLVGAALPRMDLPLQILALLIVAAFAALAWVRLLRWPVVRPGAPPQEGGG